MLDCQETEGTRVGQAEACVGERNIGAPSDPECVCERDRVRVCECVSV